MFRSNRSPLQLQPVITPPFQSQIFHSPSIALSYAPRSVSAAREYRAVCVCCALCMLFAVYTHEDLKLQVQATRVHVSVRAWLNSYL